MNRIFRILLAFLLANNAGGLTGQNLGVVNIMPGNIDPISDFEFADSLHGYVQGSGQLAYTSDAGNSWTYASSPGYSGALFLAGQALYLQAGDSVYRTTDQGQTWDALGAIGAGSYSNRSIQFFDSLNGVVSLGNSNDGNYLFKTTDGGLSWDSLPGTFGRPALWAAMNGSADIFHFVDADHGFAQVVDSFPFGFLVGTSDGGLNWDTISATKLSAFQFLDDSLGFLGMEYKTTDGGMTWESISFPYGYNSSAWLNETQGVVESGCVVVPSGGDYSTISAFYSEGDSTVGFQNQFLCTSKIQIFDERFAVAGGQMIDFTNSFPVLFRLDNVLVNTQDEQGENPRLEVFPNPSTGSFTLRSGEKGRMRVTVWNVRGHKVLERSISARTFQFDLAEYGRGMYFLRVEVGGRLQTLKLMLR